jgi:hypothetical protein
MKICQLGTEWFHVDRRTDKRTDERTERRKDRTGQDRTGQDRTGQDRTGQDRTDRTNLIVSFQNFAKAPKITWT